MLGIHLSRLVRLILFLAPQLTRFRPDAYSDWLRRILYAGVSSPLSSNQPPVSLRFVCECASAVTTLCCSPPACSPLLSPRFTPIVRCSSARASAGNAIASHQYLDGVLIIAAKCLQVPPYL